MDTESPQNRGSLRTYTVNYVTNITFNKHATFENMADKMKNAGPTLYFHNQVRPYQMINIANYLTKDTTPRFREITIKTNMTVGTSKVIFEKLLAHSKCPRILYVYGCSFTVTAVKALANGLKTSNVEFLCLELNKTDKKTFPILADLMKQNQRVFKLSLQGYFDVEKYKELWANVIPWYPTVQLTGHENKVIECLIPKLSEWDLQQIIGPGFSLEEYWRLETTYRIGGSYVRNQIRPGDQRQICSIFWDHFRQLYMAKILLLMPYLPRDMSTRFERN